MKTATRSSRTAAARRIHRHPTVRPHKSGNWTVCIGVTLDKTRTKLRPKDWYFSGTESAANAAAEKIAQRWAFIVANWSKLYQRTLTTIGSAFADRPHWQPALGEKPGPSDKAIRRYQDEPASEEEIAHTYANVDLKGVFALYKVELAEAVANADHGKTTAWTTEKNVRCALTFFDEDLPLGKLTGIEIVNAKTAALKKLSRRTADNYLAALKRMLVWFYNSDYGRGWDRPANFDKSFAVKNATSTAVVIPTLADIKAIIKKATERQRLDVMLALNCGMYAADIGRLTLDEINLEAGYIFWDREKQPQNPFRVRHDLWSETMELVRKFIQPAGTKARFFADYRGHEPTQVDCSTLAFVGDDGLPLYRVLESGKAYDKIGKQYSNIDTTHQFHNLRKGTNQLLMTKLKGHIDPTNHGQLVAAGEISKTFLAQKTPELQQLYETMGADGFGVMNHYLAEIGKLIEGGDAPDSKSNLEGE